MRFGLAVAIQAPGHAERFDLSDDVHLVDLTVTGDAADSPRHVSAVIEAGVVGEIVDPLPFDRFPGRLTFENS